MFNRILVVRIGNVGDVLFITPALRKLDSSFPKGSIDVLTSPQGKIVLENNLHINNYFHLSKIS